MIIQFILFRFFNDIKDKNQFLWNLFRYICANTKIEKKCSQQQLIRVEEIR